MLAPLAFMPLLHVGASISLTSFTVHWSTVAGLLVLAGLYEWRVRKAAGAHRRWAGGDGKWEMGAAHESRPGAHLPSPISHLRRLYFYSGLGVIFFSLNGLLHDLSDYYLF